MKKLFLLCLFIGLGTSLSLAQCCDENFKFTDWLDDPCLSSNKAFQELAKKLPSGTACHAKVGRKFYLAFNDSLGRRHLISAEEGNYDTFQATAFEGSSARAVFSALFMIGGSESNNYKVLSYHEEDGYVSPKAPFNNFAEYWQKFYVSQKKYFANKK